MMGWADSFDPRPFARPGFCHQLPAADTETVAQRLQALKHMVIMSVAAQEQARNRLLTAIEVKVIAKMLAGEYKSVRMAGAMKRQELFTHELRHRIGELASSAFIYVLLSRNGCICFLRFFVLCGELRPGCIDTQIMASSLRRVSMAGSGWSCLMALKWERWMDTCSHAFHTTPPLAISQVWGRQQAPTIGEDWYMSAYSPSLFRRDFRLKIPHIQQYCLIVPASNRALEKLLFV